MVGDAGGTNISFDIAGDVAVELATEGGREDRDTL